MSTPTPPVAWICHACGIQIEPTPAPPKQCAICDDERQYVDWRGQRWTTLDDLRNDHRISIDREDGVVTLSLTPRFAIGQRAFLVPVGDGRNVLWECLSTITDEALSEIEKHGGVSCIAISHPHFYASMVDWSEALGGVPIYLHDNDRRWVARPSPRIRFWSGEQLSISETIELVRLPGHFDGSAGLWWKTGPRPGGSLFSGDALQVTMDRRHVSFMYSYPNAIPLGTSAVHALRSAVAPLNFEDVFGYDCGRQIIGGAKAAVDNSFSRYLARLYPRRTYASSHT